MTLFDGSLYSPIGWFKTSEVLALLGIRLHQLRAFRRKGLITAYEPTPYMRANMDLQPRTAVYKAEDVKKLKEILEVPVALKPS